MYSLKRGQKIWIKIFCMTNFNFESLDSDIFFMKLRFIIFQSHSGLIHFHLFFPFVRKILSQQMSDGVEFKLSTKTPVQDHLHTKIAIACFFLKACKSWEDVAAEKLYNKQIWAQLTPPQPKVIEIRMTIPEKCTKI